MNERLAYFCDRATAHCHLYAWPGTDGAGASLYQVFCRAPLDTSRLDPNGSTVDSETLRQCVAAAGGGLIAQTRQTDTTTELRVAVIPGDGYAPSTQFLLLNPGAEPTPLPLDNRALALASGTFVLLPATRTDQSILGTFLEHLYRLPGDYRGLLLNVLRRPGIEATMGRLEHRLDRLDRLLAAPAATVPEGGAPHRFADRWSWLLASLLVLNLLGVISLWVKITTDQAAAPVFQIAWPDATDAPFLPAATGSAIEAPLPKAKDGHAPQEPGLDRHDTADRPDSGRDEAGR
ncbi:hypothetical protein [uncultured Lamprocystis sp.]|jgi:hypothetical protein|uniref:hypothetical protein n=1 Tax=uncultured Lamprocystis sp. TaxID=543132 RepID=UPI0025F6CB72|nr:hypothetical protein [uncultured Lamprocystis sp.]